MKQDYEGFLRVRLDRSLPHYDNGLVAGHSLLGLMADCASEVGIAMEGADGYLARWENADFLEPVYVGDWIEVRARLVRKGTRSRAFACEVAVVIRSGKGNSAKPEVLLEPVVAARGQLVGVAPK